MREDTSMKRGERVEDRKFTSRVDARAGRGGRGGWSKGGGTSSQRVKSGLTRFRGRAV